MNSKDLSRVVEDNQFSESVRSLSIRTSWESSNKGKGFTIGKHTKLAGERPDTQSDRHMLGVWCGGGPVESRNPDGSYTLRTKEHGPHSFFPSDTVVPGTRRTHPSDFILISFDRRLVRSVEEEMDEGSSYGLDVRHNFRDRMLSQLVSLLVVDTNHGFQFGHLFTDHIVHAFMMRLLRLKETPRETTRTRIQAPFSCSEACFRSHARSY